jgi:hypothetical protein
MNKLKDLGFLIADVLLAPFWIIGKVNTSNKKELARDKKMILRNQFVPKLENFIATFQNDEETKEDLKQYTQSELKIMINFIVGRTLYWINFFKTLVIKNDLKYYNGKDVFRIKIMRVVMSKHISGMRSFLMENYDIPEYFLENFDRIRYTNMFSMHSKILFDMVRLKLFGNKYSYWNLAFTIFGGSVLNMNKGTIKNGKVLFKEIEHDKSKKKS